MIGSESCLRLKVIDSIEQHHSTTLRLDLAME